MLRATVLLLALTACGCMAVMVPPPMTGEPTPLRPPVDAWARVLKTQVDEQGRVNLNGLAADRTDLDRFVSWVADNSPANRPDMFRTQAQVLAYHLNAYNALVLFNVLDAGVGETYRGFAKVKFFRLRELFVGGQPLSLDAYKNDVIRKQGEPRVHFALNDLSMGSPRLMREPFSAEKLEQQLERETRRFLSEERNVRVDSNDRTVYLSGILNFYGSDFLSKAPSLLAYVNRYRVLPVPEDYQVEFAPYDWTINRQPKS